MWLALTAIASLALGYELSRCIWRGVGRSPWAVGREDPIEPRPTANGQRPTLLAVERAALTFLLGTSAWLASAWVLALLHLLVHPALLVRTAAFAIAAAVLAWRRGARPRLPRLDPMACVALIPVALWLAFALWRGAIVPPLTHDALSYHLPKAVLFTRAHAYDPLWQYGWFFTRRPISYEMLLADAIAMDGVDDFTEWFGAIFYAGFVLAGAALAARWWPMRRVALGVALFLGAIPVVLLHSVAHKNDLMTAFFFVAALLAAARFFSAGEWRDLAMTIIALAAAIGTKTHALVVAASLAPFIVWRMIEDRARWSAARLAAVAALGAVAFILLGGVEYVVRVLPHPTTLPSYTVDSGGYGEWSNLWKAFYVFLAQPVEKDSFTLWVPWSAQRWFWPRHEIYFSHLGAPFAICLLALPFAILKSKKFDRERVFISLATLISFLVILPVRRVPDGIYLVGLPRFILYIVPVVFGWTLAPFIAAKARYAQWTTAAGVILFALLAFEAGSEDRFCQFWFVEWAAKHPGTRRIPFDDYRAASVMDRIAGPNDSVAIDVGPSSWIYPAFGARLTRPVTLIPPGGTVPDTRFIVIDRYWNAVWGNPRFTDLGQWSYIGQGVLLPEDRRMFDLVRRDPRYEMLYLDPKVLQAVFRHR